jgi:hypothetical protein
MKRNISFMPCKNKISTDSNFHYKKFNFLPAVIPIREKVGLVFFGQL